MNPKRVPKRREGQHGDSGTSSGFFLGRKSSAQQPLELLLEAPCGKSLFDSHCHPYFLHKPSLFTPFPLPLLAPSTLCLASSSPYSVVASCVSSCLCPCASLCVGARVQTCVCRCWCVYWAVCCGVLRVRVVCEMESVACVPCARYVVCVCVAWRGGWWFVGRCLLLVVPG